MEDSKKTQQSVGPLKVSSRTSCPVTGWTENVDCSFQLLFLFPVDESRIPFSEKILQQVRCVLLCCGKCCPLCEYLHCMLLFITISCRSCLKSSPNNHHGKVLIPVCLKYPHFNVVLSLQTDLHPMEAA